MRKFRPFILKEKIKDKYLLRIIKDIIFSFPGGKNCPIGNLTSQLFGNIYLNKLDKLLKHKIKVKNYCRYCDDCVILSNSKEQLLNIQKQIHQFVELELKQKISYSEVFPFSIAIKRNGNSFYLE